MGQNLILNMADHGYTVVAYNRTVSKVDEFIHNEAAGTRVVGTHSIEEFVQANTAMQQASSLTSLNGRPLIVLTADKGSNDDQWPAKQDHLATLSTNSAHRHADATHESLLDDQADSAAASQAINDVVASVRNSTPLASR